MVSKVVLEVDGKVKPDDYSEEDVFATLVAKEADHDIQFRTLSWQRATLLLFGEYVCLAILALPWSFSVLGWGVGLFVQIAMGLVTWYTSYVLWQWSMKNPEIRDICDIAAALFPRFGRFAAEATAAMFLLNNIFVVGFHVFTGAKIFNALSGHSQCTVVFQVLAAIIGMVASLPRTLNHVSWMSVFSAVTMGTAILLTLVWCGVQDHPSGGYGGVYPTLGPVKTHGAFPKPGLTFVEGFNAVLNIAFLWIGQILYPSFIAEMRRPQDFPKALAALTALEMSLFLVVSVVGYFFLGQYAKAPMIDSLQNPIMRKSCYGLVLGATIVIAVIYTNVTAKFLLKRIMPQSRHLHSHSVIGWGSWVGAVVSIWAIGFVLGNVIPSMGDFLSIMCAAFDSFFGFIFWAVAYWHLNRGNLWSSPLKIATSLLNIVIFTFGLFMLGPGLYSSVQAIIDDYAGHVRQPFSCATNL